jgi:hypothetical protein
MRWTMWRRRSAAGARNPVGPVAIAAGALLILAVLAFAATVVTTPEIGAAGHVRSGIHVVLLLLSAAAVLCATLPVVTLVSWRRSHGTPARNVSLSLLSLAGVIVAVLLWHYRLVGFAL